jgi:hypothetical protein
MIPYINFDPLKMEIKTHGNNGSSYTCRFLKKKIYIWREYNPEKTHCARITGAGWVRVTEPQPVPAPVCTRARGPHGFTNP